jgi:mRNA-degrading endonuclease RelE of RelBE toxin-antitoxin system
MLDFSPSMPYINTMSAAIAYTSVYAKRAAKILRAEEREAMETHIAENPEIHPVVPGTGGVRKARWGRQGKGKRGRVRVIYFYRAAADVVYLLDIYTKAAKEDLTQSDRRQLKEMVNRLKGVQ